MPPFISVVGRRFGRLAVVGRAPDCLFPSQAVVFWRCLCDCGRAAVVRSQHLRTGVTRSCGCLHNEELRARITVHGGKRGGRSTREYLSWANARRRCFNQKHKNFRDYGGRGITMCAEWRHDFAAFLAHIGRCPDGLTLDRIENNGNYEPGNVRWATRTQQQANKRPRRKKAA